MPPQRRASTVSQVLALLALAIGVGVVALAAVVGAVVVHQWNSPYTPSGTFLAFALVLAGSSLVTVGVCGDRPLAVADAHRPRGFEVLPIAPDAGDEAD
jgi:hypothetical protein